MDLSHAATVARRQIGELFAADAPRDIRLESWLYDDHLMVWSLTLGFTVSDPGDGTRRRKVVRVSETDKTVLSVKDP